MFQIKAKLICNKRVSGKYLHLAIEAPKIAKGAKPGQFVEVKVSNSDEPLLRRPFSIHRIKGQNIEILYEVIGKGTELLSQKRAGEYLDVIGPLGNGFSYSSPVVSCHLAVLVAGGMGVAPLVFIAERLMNQKPKTKNQKPLVLIGAKRKTQILCAREFNKLGCKVKIATDDGSAGFKGKVTELLKNLVSTIDSRGSIIYACGPRSMLNEIRYISQRYKIPAQISLEEHMACGIGACLGCVVNTVDGYKRVCKDGPVFEADKISC